MTTGRSSTARARAPEQQGRHSPGRSRSRGVGRVLACEFPFGFRPLVAGVAQPAKRLPPNATCGVGAAGVDRSNESAAWAAVCAEVLLRPGHTVDSTAPPHGTVYSSGWPAAVWFGCNRKRSLASKVGRLRNTRRNAIALVRDRSRVHPSVPWCSGGSLGTG